ncbi:MAG: hypothetical protein PHV16_01190 [Candidatus Nanoarchaeia archaeon]|nr:hypothetical protein [Candidatus Nanoarchaeia archaeon]
MKKAQSSIEVALLVGVMFLIFNVFLIVVVYRMVEVQNQNDRRIIEDMTSVIESEIILASGVEDGYIRTFDVPTTLNGIDYSIELINSTVLKSDYSKLILEYVDFTEKYETVARLPKNVDGVVHHGKNEIVKKDGIVCLNVCS